MSKKFTGTLLGAAAGFFMSGSIMGGIIGGVLGNMFDSTKDVTTGYGPGTRTRSRTGYQPRQDYDPFAERPDDRVREFIFISNLVALMTSVAKADREIHPSEVNAIVGFLQQNFSYTGHDRKVIENLIKESSGRSLDIKSICNDTRRLLEYPERIMLVRMLYIVALSDKVFKDVERERIETIVSHLQIKSQDHEHIKVEMKITASRDHYKALDIESSATDAEVKAAYREMVKKYHPDKVAHLGKDFAKLADEKFKDIQKAYDKISQERGL